MMNSSLRERLGRLGPEKAVDQNRSGFTVVLTLRPAPDLSRVRTIPAIQALHKRGLPMLRAKRAVEAMVDRGQAIVLVPKVDDLSAFARELAENGVTTSVIDNGEVDVKRIRERIGLTQEEFALRFGLDAATLQNWEAGRRDMPAAVRSYFRVIDKMPEQASQALEIALTQI